MQSAGDPSDNAFYAALSAAGLFRGDCCCRCQNAAVPVALHLDHGDSLELVKECLDAGYTSVMFDGSRLPFAENADLTAQAVQMAKLRRQL